MSAAFDRAFTITVGAEGGMSTVQSDPGNWTGGKVGAGALKGTKYGISAASYPALDIANLTLDQAKTIYQTDYWAKVAGEALPPPLAMIAFDGAVNSGPGQSVRWLQAAVGVAQDGTVGPLTLAAAAKAKPEQVAVDMLTARLLFMASLSTWPTFRAGWTRRLFGLIGAAFEGGNTTLTIAPPLPIDPANDVTIPNIEAAVRRVLAEPKGAAA